MKLYEKLTACLLAVIMILGLAVTTASAEDYTYKVRIFPGNAGTASSGECIEVDGIALGTRVTISMPNSYTISFGGETITVAEGEKYYIRGVRVSGQDPLSTLSFEVNQDIDLVASYGMANNIVEYTVSFLDAETGEPLADSVTYYGSLGDKPVAAYQYIEGYEPDYYNITGTLKETGNAWEFHYTRIEAEESTEAPTETETEEPTETEEEPTTTGEGGEGESTTEAPETTTTAEGESTTAPTQPTTEATTEEATTTVPGGEEESTTAEGGEEESTTAEGGESESSGEDITTAPEDETTAGEETETEPTGPSEIIDIDDETIPQADINGDSDNSGIIKGFTNLPLAAQIGIIAGIVVVLGGLIALILLGIRRRKKKQ